MFWTLFLLVRVIRWETPRYITAWSFISTYLNSLYQMMFCAKESERIRRRFDMNVDISKRLKKIIEDSCGFSNVFRLIVFRKIGKILPKCILFLQNIILKRVLRPILYDYRQNLLCFLKNCCLWAFSPRIQKLNLPHQLKQWIERWPRYTPKVMFYVGVENIQTYRTVLYIPLKTLPFGSVVSRQLRNDLWEELLVRIPSNYLF